MASLSLLGSPFFHSPFEENSDYRRGVSCIARPAYQPGLNNLPGSLELRKNRVRRIGVELRRSCESTFWSIAVLAAKNDALTVQVHSGTGISQVGEHNLHLDQRTDRGHYIRLDVDPESVDVTRNAPPAMRLP